MRVQAAARAGGIRTRTLCKLSCLVYGRLPGMATSLFRYGGPTLERRSTLRPLP